MLTLLQKKTIATLIFCLWNVSHLQGMDEQNYAPLQLACVKGNEKEVESMIKRGCLVDIRILSSDINNPEYFKKLPTPLHLTAKTGNLNIMNLLLKANPNINSTHCDNDNTPLHVAVWFKRPDCVKTLINHGAQLNSTNCYGSTPVHIAAFGNLPCLEELLADNYQSFNYQLCISKNKNGDTPLSCAAIAGAAQCLKKLLKTIDYDLAHINAEYSGNMTLVEIADHLGHAQCYWDLVVAGANTEKIDARNVIKDNEPFKMFLQAIKQNGKNNPPCFKGNQTSCALCKENFEYNDVIMTTKDHDLNSCHADCATSFDPECTELSVFLPI